MRKRILALLLSFVLLAAAGIPVLAVEETAENESAEPYVSPIDFASLQQSNSDIYGWLRIEDTDIDYAVVQSESADDYYLIHDINGNYDLNGSIFSQHEYNSKDFEDPVTVLYGHNMKTGKMFGHLRQSYTDPDFFEAHKVITIYTPEEELDYKVFAAVPYSNELIPYEHDFEDVQDYTNFFNGVLNIRNLSARFDEANKPEFGDRVLILSTCISGTNQRFLVMATLESDLENRSES